MGEEVAVTRKCELQPMTPKLRFAPLELENDHLLKNHGPNNGHYFFSFCLSCLLACLPENSSQTLVGGLMQKGGPLKVLTLVRRGGNLKINSNFPEKIEFTWFSLGWG